MTHDCEFIFHVQSSNAEATGELTKACIIFFLPLCTEMTKKKFLQTINAHH